MHERQPGLNPHSKGGSYSKCSCLTEVGLTIDHRRDRARWSGSIGCRTFSHLHRGRSITVLSHSNVTFDRVSHLGAFLTAWLVVSLDTQLAQYTCPSWLFCNSMRGVPRTFLVIFDLAGLARALSSLSFGTNAHFGHGQTSLLSDHLSLHGLRI